MLLVHVVGVVIMKTIVGWMMMIMLHVMCIIISVNGMSPLRILDQSIRAANSSFSSSSKDGGIGAPPQVAAPIDIYTITPSLLSPVGNVVTITGFVFFPNMYIQIGASSLRSTPSSITENTIVVDIWESRLVGLSGTQNVYITDATGTIIYSTSLGSVYVAPSPVITSVSGLASDFFHPSNPPFLPYCYYADWSITLTGGTFANHCKFYRYLELLDSNGNRVFLNVGNSMYYQCTQTSIQFYAGINPGTYMSCAWRHLVAAWGDMGSSYTRHGAGIKSCDQNPAPGFCTSYIYDYCTQC
jgi:hypothetical protein